MVCLSPKPETNLYGGKNLFDDISLVTTLQPEKMFLPTLSQDSAFLSNARHSLNGLNRLCAPKDVNFCQYDRII